MANYSALFFQNFRPPKKLKPKVHAQNRRHSGPILLCRTQIFSTPIFCLRKRPRNFQFVRLKLSITKLSITKFWSFWAVGVFILKYTVCKKRHRIQWKIGLQNGNSVFFCCGLFRFFLLWSVSGSIENSNLDRTCQSWYFYLLGVLLPRPFVAKNLVGKLP